MDYPLIYYGIAIVHNYKQVFIIINTYSVFVTKYPIADKKSMPSGFFVYSLFTNTKLACFSISYEMTN